MSDTRKTLALSCSFASVNGKLVQVKDEGRITFDLLAQANKVIDSKYQVLSLIGEGGMGAIYKVHHLQLRKDMALKTFTSGNLSPETWQRFHREAQAIAKLKHRNIVEVFDFGIVGDGIPYYTMTLLKGENLAEYLNRVGALPGDVALKLFLQVADALAHAHRNNIVHRDIKPGNIFLEKKGSNKPGQFDVKIVDFGIAKLAEDSSSAAGQSLTQAGTIFGSPLYMSPEQSSGQVVDQRSDIYSFGCTLFEALYGEPPFRGDTALATIMSHQNDKPPRLSDVLIDSMLPQRLDGLVARLLAKRPENRYQTFDEVVRDINICLEDINNKVQLKINRSSLGGTAERNFSDDLIEVDSARQNSQVLGAVKRRSIVVFSTLLVVAAAVKVLIPAFDSLQHPKVVPPSRYVPAELPIQEDNSDWLKARAQAVKDTTPFRRSNEGGWKTFVFPEYDRMGMGSFTINDQPTSKVLCHGVVRVPARDLFFHPGYEFFQSPELFHRFRKGDISGLVLSPIEDGWTVEKFSQCEHLDDLSVIKMPQGNFDKSIISHLEKFPSLRSLYIADCPITGADLAQSRLVSRLAKLNVGEIAKMPVFCAEVARLRDKCPLRELMMRGCSIKDNDLKTISEIKSLIFLELRRNNIKGACLADLAALPDLAVLDITENPIEPKYLDCLAKFPRLKLLRITKTNAVQEYMRHCRPHFQVLMGKNDEPAN